jgi:DNA-binding transcriptional MerR regulator/methylmalonyl-CoA mutase cobalamin-binding subunit
MSAADENLDVSEGLASIGEAARRSGVPKDTLRIWERRYGFPAPLRDAAGDRAYPSDQVEKLRLIRILIDQGRRPSKLVTRSLAALQAEFQVGAAERSAPEAWVIEALDLLRAHDVEGLRARLVATLHERGLRPFVIDNVAALSAAVGEAWIAGELAVFEEHLFTELIARVLRGALAGVGRGGDARPRILLTTLPGEPHALGLLMAECLMTLSGGACFSLGVETPPHDVAQASAAHRIDVVALSFSAMYGPAAARRDLKTLRDVLPPEVEIWAGGACPGLRGQPIAGVRTVPNLEAIEALVAGWGR